MKKYDNVLMDNSIDLPVEAYKNEGKILLERALENVTHVYSYVTYAIYNSGRITGWNIHYHISQVDYYNTIAVDDAIKSICDTLDDTISEEDKKRVVGYGQPPLDVLVVVLDNLVHKLAREQAQYWPIEYEDLYQTCRLCLCKLYNGGYYVHKNLLRRTFINEILVQLRPERFKPIMLSLDAVVYNEEGKDALTAQDILIDENELYAMEDAEDDEVQKQVFEQMKDVVIEIIGPRQYDQLLREYGNKMTTNWSRKTMQTLKDTLRRKKIDSSLFRRYY